MPPTTYSIKKMKAALLRPLLSLKCLGWQAPFECETALTSPSVSPSDRSSLSAGEGLFERTPPATGGRGASVRPFLDKQALSVAG